MRSRKYNISVFDTIYEIVKDKDNPFICTYCGLPADQIDHYPPISRISDYRAARLENEIYIKIPCCSECNLLLSDSLTDSFLGRINYAKEKLEYKYRKYLKGKVWRSSDIVEADLQGLLKTSVIRHAELQKIMRKRIDYEGGTRLYIEYINNKFK